MEAENNTANLSLCVNIPLAVSADALRGRSKVGLQRAVGGGVGGGRNACRDMECLRVASDHGLLVCCVSPQHRLVTTGAKQIIPVSIFSCLDNECNVCVLKKAPFPAC